MNSEIFLNVEYVIVGSLLVMDQSFGILITSLLQLPLGLNMDRVEFE